MADIEPTAEPPTMVIFELRSPAAYARAAQGEFGGCKPAPNTKPQALEPGFFQSPELKPIILLSGLVEIFAQVPLGGTERMRAQARPDHPARAGFHINPDGAQATADKDRAPLRMRQIEMQPRAR